MGCNCNRNNSCNRCWNNNNCHQNTCGCGCGCANPFVNCNGCRGETFISGTF